MLKAPIPDNEPQRLESLRSLDLLDTGMEERFDRITRMAQRLFDVPIATLSLVDSKREFYKSCQGLKATEGDRAISFCGHALLENGLFVVPNTMKDPRFKDNPMVIGKPFIRFYAGQSLTGPGGYRIGTLCIKDYKSRHFTKKQLQGLKDLSIWAEIELNCRELTRAIGDIKQSHMEILQSEKIASISQLAAGVAHEINNPVGFISNNLELLGQYVSEYIKILRMVELLKKSVGENDLEGSKIILKDIDQFEDEIQLARIINDTDNLLMHNQKGIERIQKIVMDLRNFAREDNDMKLSVKIEDIIESLLSIIHHELEIKAEIKKNYTDTPMVKCNAQRMEQVFINLLMNACQSIEDKGIIEIKTYQDGRFLCVDISDTGRGIPPENLKRIFDAFFTTKPIGMGMGLGLSVSYEIVKKHGGDIRVQSRIGQGSTFTVMLPLTEDP